MVHSGYEPTAVAQTFGSLKGFLRTVKVTLFGFGPSGTILDEPATELRSTSPKAGNTLVQLHESLPSMDNPGNAAMADSTNESAAELLTRP